MFKIKERAASSRLGSSHVKKYNTMPRVGKRKPRVPTFHHILPPPPIKNVKKEKESVFVYDGEAWKVNQSLYENEYKSLGVGSNAGKQGKTNVYIGVHAGENDPSDENTYVGCRSGTVPSGGLNTFVGQESGRYSSGTQNTFVGDSTCGYTGSDGSYNTFIGAEVGFRNTKGSGNFFGGAVSGASNTEGNWNVFIGQSAGHSNETGNGNVFVGANSGVSNVSGESCICLGDGADVSSEDAKGQIVFGSNTMGYGNNTITFPDSLVTFPNGTEVNFSSPNGGCLYPVSSSRRWKQDIQPIENKIDTSKVYELEPVIYRAKEGHGNPEDIHVGLIAEEVEKYFPELVPKDKDGLPSSVRYSLLCVIMLAELKKLKKIL